MGKKATTDHVLHALNTSLTYSPRPPRTHHVLGQRVSEVCKVEVGLTHALQLVEVFLEPSLFEDVHEAFGGRDPVL